MSAAIHHQRPLWLKGGHVIDGSGAPRFRADVLVRHGMIERIDTTCGLSGAAAADGADVIDVRGCIVAPGFIDVHTHDDHIVLLEPAMRPKVSQGVTTVVVGNCGISLSPFRNDTLRDIPPPLNLLGDRTGFRFGDMAAYADAVDRAVPAVNVAALVGHTTLRAAHMADLTRKASPAELDAMCASLAQAMQDGAVGLSTGVFYTPAAAADVDEVTALARVAAAAGGVYATHIRNEFEAIREAMLEAMDAAHDARIPLVLSHHKCAGPQNWGQTKVTLELIDDMRQRQDIALDVYPYVAGSTVLRRDMVDGEIDILVTWSDPHPDLAGRSLADIATMWDCTQQEACDRLQPGGACYFQMHEDDVQRVLRHPLAMVGSDGLPHDRHPHPRLWGTFPRVLGHYSRELGLFDLETAVHKMTGLSAGRFGLAGRGLVRDGYCADLVVFDPDAVADLATFSSPTKMSAGIEWVIVNGVPTFRAGEWLAFRGGRFLRHGK
jgi:N-acyl-D-amino-acid deacylase